MLINVHIVESGTLARQIVASCRHYAQSRRTDSMEFTGTINGVGLNPFIDTSTVVLRLENGTDIEIIVSKFMAKTLAHK